MLGSTNNLSRGSAALSSEIPTLPQHLPLEPKLRRVLGVPLGSTSEDNCFGASQSRHAPPVATEELKHFKESVQDARKMARDRVLKFHESIAKLEKYREALSSKKRQRSDILSSDKSAGASLTKMGSQIHRNSHELITQRLEEKTKTVGMNKRVRTSVADMRAVSRSAGSSKLHMVAEKEGDMPSAVSGAPARIEEKIRRLPVGGEGWDTKKRKRSVGAVGNRAIGGDRDIKRALQPKLSADSKLRSCDMQGFRLKSSPGVSSINKLDVTIEPAGSDASSILKNELESTSFPADRTPALEHRAKGNSKTNIHDGKPVGNPNTMLKPKVSRGPRSGPVMVLDSSSKAQPSSGAFQGWEQPSNVNKVSMLGVANNQKRSMAMGSSPHAMAQWVGQRPHKNSRTRRANLVSPVSNHEAQTSSPGFATSDLTAKTSPFGTSGSILANAENRTPKIKRELENVSSPFSFSESEESGAGENKLKDKGIDSSEVSRSATRKVGAFTVPLRKNKIPNNEIGDGMRRQGRSGGGSSLTRQGMHPVREKLENLPTTKPIPSARTASDKSKSKSGRPPYKKLKDRKPSNRVSVLHGGTAEFTGESDDDREELFVAAKSARNASDLACSGPFWKKMESVFSSVCPEDMSYFKKQLSFAEELDESLSQMFGLDNNALKEAPDWSVERQGSDSNQESVRSDASCGNFDMRRLAKITPLYQRVLSALIEEDESEEVYHLSEGKNMVLHYASDDSHCGSCNLIDIETKDRDKMESEVESESDFQSQKNYLLDRSSCEKSAASINCRNPSMSNSLHSNEQWLGDEVLSHSDGVVVSEICSNDLGQSHPREMNGQVFSSFDSQYQLMCIDDKLLLELQSIGLFPETLPDLAEGEIITQDVIELKEKLYQQVGKKKNSLGKIDRAIQEVRDVEKRRIENVAMDQLVEMAYRKRMACRGSHASKSGVRKVSRQVALGFIKRTLARCQKFEETGSSCFSEPSLHDVLFSVPPCNNAAKSFDGVGSGSASNTCNEASNHQTEARGSGAVSSTVERYDGERGSSDALQAVNSSENTYSKHGSSINKVKKREVLIEDVVGSASSRVTSSTLNSTVTGARGKRCERERDQNREPKTKAKAKQKNNQSSTPGTTHPTGPAGSSGNVSSKTEIKQNSLEETEEQIDIGNLQDIFNSDDEKELQNLDDDGLALALDDGLGSLDDLELPMDFLGNINMF